jgi:hypothetical protein
MAYVILSLFLFCASVMTHVLFCRKANKTHLQARAFIFIAFIFWGVYLGVAWAIQQAGLLPAQSFWGLPFKFTAAVIFILLVPVYLCFYVLTQLTSPSKKILLTISYSEGISRADIVASVQKEDFITTRLTDLSASGCVVSIDNRYVLTVEGRKLAAILNFMQRVLGREVGG